MTMNNHPIGVAENERGEVRVCATDSEPVKVALDAVSHVRGMFEDSPSEPTREYVDDLDNLATVLSDAYKNTNTHGSFEWGLHPHDLATIAGAVHLFPSTKYAADPDVVDRAEEAWNAALDQRWRLLKTVGPLVGEEAADEARIQAGGDPDGE